MLAITVTVLSRIKQKLPNGTERQRSRIWLQRNIFLGICISRAKVLSVIQRKRLNGIAGRQCREFLSHSTISAPFLKRVKAYLRAGHRRLIGISRQLNKV